jgi:parallel beta-helix repeat protein
MKNNIFRKGVVFALILLFFGAGFFPSTVGIVEKRTTIQEVRSPGYIQDLIDNASDGDTIYIPSGTYYENIIINKSISLIGEDKDTTIIDGRGYGTVIFICAKDVNASCFTIQNGNPAIDISNSESAVVTGNNVRSWDTGIKAEGSDFCLCENNNISKNIYGIFLTRAHNNIIKGNDISNNSKGIHLEYSYRNTVQKNNFLDNEQDAFFTTSFINHWSQNYWNKPRLLPKLIRGDIQLFIEFKWFNFDLCPALKPYDI